MITILLIKIGNKKIKLFNWFIFIGSVVIIFYFLFTIIFMLPIFNKTYNYEIEKENYKINNKVIFKSNFLKCKVKEKYHVTINDKEIKKYLNNDLIKDGFNKKSNNLYIKNKKYDGMCKNVIKNYNKTHSKNYVLFKLNGKTKDKLIYKNDYKDLYVVAKINNKDIKKVNIYSNLNINKIGKYVISYTINISKNYKQRLYRIVEVIDDEKPIINLLGSKKVELNYSDKYKELGFNANDNYDGDITKKVKVKGSVNSKKPGAYEIIYNVSDTSLNKTSIKRIVVVKENESKVSIQKPKIIVKDGLTYVNNILIVNKKYGLRKEYNPGVNIQANEALKLMQNDASVLGLNLKLVSGFRSYETQKKLYNDYVLKYGKEKTDTFSAQPGYSEHQTGLAFDVGEVSDEFANTKSGVWLANNCYLYGFIIRYPKDKIDVTGYKYEPWHIRYLGKDIAKKVYESGLSLEEYLNIN